MANFVGQAVSCVLICSLNSFTVSFWKTFGETRHTPKFVEFSLETSVNKFTPTSTVSESSKIIDMFLHYFSLCTVDTMYCKPLPNKPWFLSANSTSPLKTLWKKEKLLVTSNFSFFHSVFYPFQKLSSIFNKLEIVVCKLLRFERVQNLSFGKEITAK